MTSRPRQTAGSRRPARRPADTPPIAQNRPPSEKPAAPEPSPLGTGGRGLGTLIERAAGGPGRGGSTGHPAFALGEDPAQEQRIVLQLGPDVPVAQDVEQVPSGLELLLDVQTQLVLTAPATACLGRDHRAAAEPPPA